jgi:hypothetical protein
MIYALYVSVPVRSAPVIASPQLDRVVQLPTVLGQRKTENMQ